jgi:hypothetical protein
MTEIMGICESLLTAAGFATREAQGRSKSLLLFENDLVLGFLFVFADPDSLMKQWQDEVTAAISAHQFGLRKAGEKAWNTYVVLLAEKAGTEAQIALSTGIEEDLTGTRKIVRFGVSDPDEAGAALLPLLPLQNAPRLEAVDSSGEIRERTTELPARAIEAFLSKAEDSVVVQILEEAT